VRQESTIMACPQVWARPPSSCFPSYAGREHRPRSRAILALNRLELQLAVGIADGPSFAARWARNFEVHWQPLHACQALFEVAADVDLGAVRVLAEGHHVHLLLRPVLEQAEAGVTRASQSGELKAEVDALQDVGSVFHVRRVVIRRVAHLVDELRVHLSQGSEAPWPVMPTIFSHGSCRPLGRSSGVLVKSSRVPRRRGVSEIR
jgi:hypothetical protein